jgi:hypothetical protein
MCGLIETATNMLFERRALRERWRGQEARIAAIIDDFQRNRDWTVHLLADPMGRWKALPLIRTSVGSNGSEGASRDLRGITLENVVLTHSDALADADLDYAVLDGIAVDGGSWRGTSLRRVVCKRECVFRGVNFEYADFSSADLGDSSFSGSRFKDVKIRGANFSASILDGVQVERLDFNFEGGFGIIPWKWTRLPNDPERLASLDTSRADRRTLWAIEEAQAFAICRLRFPIFSKAWHVLTNAGRSPFRLFLWVVATWLFFGWVYSGFPIPGRESSFATSLSPELVIGEGTEVSRVSRFMPFYLSAVTLTTLGYGDVHPKISDWKAQLYVTIEAFLGYFFLGLLVSLLVERLNWIGAPRQNYRERESVDYRVLNKSGSGDTVGEESTSRQRK